jgi:hypothetical protein
MDSVREKLNLLKKLAIEKKSANYSNKNQHHHTTNEQTELNDHEKVHTTQPTSSSDSNNNNNKINSLNGSENKQEKEESNKQHINKLSLINSINNNNNNNILEGENKIEFILNNKSETESITPVGLLIENKENKQETTTKTKDNTKINDINNNSLEIDSADHLNRMKILNNSKTSSLNPPAPAPPPMDSRIRSVSIDNSNFKLTGQIIDTDDLIKKSSSFKYSKRTQDIYDKERASSNESIHKIGLLQQQQYLLNPNFNNNNNNNYLKKQSAPLVVPEVINELTSNNEASDLDQIDNKTATPNKNKDYSDLSLPNTRLKNNKYVKYLRNTYTSPSITVENSKSRTNSLIRADQSFIRSDRIDRMPSTLTLLNTNGGGSGGSGSNYNSQIDKIKEKFSKISDKTNILSITPAPSHLLVPTLLSAVTTNIIKNNNNINKIKANNLNESDNLYSKMNIYNSSNLNSIDDNINNNKNYNISSYNKNINKEILNEKTTLVDSPKTLRKYNKSKTSDLSGLILDLNLNNNNNSNNNYNTNTNTNNETIDITTTTTSASSSTKLDPYQDIYYNNSKNYLNVNNNNKSKLIKSILKSPSNPNEKSICFDDYVNIIPSSPPTTKQASPIPTIILNNYINETINNNNNNFKNRIFVKSPTPAREIPLLEDDFNQENSNNNENDDFLLNENNLNSKNRNRFNKKKQPATLRSKSVEFSLSLLDLNNNNNNNNNNSNNFDLIYNQDMHSVHIDESAMMMHSSRPNLLRQNAFTKSLGENLDTLNNASQQHHHHHHQQPPHSHHHPHQRQSKSTHNGRHARHSRYYRNKKSNQKSSSFSSTSLSSSSTYSSASSNERYVSKTNNEEINRLAKKNRKISFISSFVNFFTL